MISIFGFIILIVFVVFAYRTANDYGRNGVLWAVITFVAGIVTQIIIPIILVMIIAIVMTVRGSTPEQVQQDLPAFTLTLLGIGLSFAVAFLILRYLSRIPDEETFDAPPPAPPENFA